MIELLRTNPLLLLFIVAALGYWLGSIRLGSNQLGVSAVLFVGLFFGSLDDSLEIPPVIFLLGLAMFVYTVGLSSGPAFFAAFQRQGSRNLVFILLTLGISALLAVGLHFLLDLDPATTAGVFAGSSTNTAALAGLLDTVQKNFPVESQASLIEAAVVGYSISYPMGVVGVMLAIGLMRRLLRIDYAAEAQRLRNEYPVDTDISSVTLEVRQAEACGISIRDLLRREGWVAVFGRIQRGDRTWLSNWDSTFEPGDRVVVAAGSEVLAEVEARLGPRSPVEIPLEPDYQRRRIFVSNPEVAGKRLAELQVGEHYAAIVSRVRRGDVDLLARGDTVIELGDRIRFVARREDVPAIVKLFGDSYQQLSQINLLSFGLGMALGLLLGMVTFTLPGGIAFQLGYAGGPLLVALALGSLRRTGPIVWTLPYSANLTLRQIGLTLLLAAVSIRSGHTFVDTLAQGGGWLIFLAGTLVSVLTALSILFLGYKVFRLPFAILTGMVASQPAILDFAVQQARNPLPNFGYTVMFPLALIAKIVFVQLLFGLLP
ncbi:MAG: aspartate:alanine exchanger family transporter [Bacteroidia bacterium]